jgi:glycosyltransferase involved in cell wall biosynthesis
VTAAPATGAEHVGQGERRRAVVLVNNSLKAYSRANRFARSLAAAGWETTLVGVAEDGLPAEERLPPGDWPVDASASAEPWTLASHPAATGDLTPGARPPSTARDVHLVRLAPSGPLAGFLHHSTVRRALVHRLPGLGAVARTVGWPLAARAWGHSLRSLPPADLYHACGFGAAVAGADLARRARRAGRAGRLVYDYIDIFQASDVWYRYPRWRRAVYPVVEASAVRATSAMTSVSDEYAGDAKRRFRRPRSPYVVYNCPPRTEIPPADTDLLREATGIPPERAVVLFIGRFGPDRGLFEAGDAVLELRDAAFVAMGFGRLKDALRERDGDPRRAGRHFTLPPVAPEEVTRWSASADITVFLAPGENLNQRWMTPNKLWESLAGGAPVLVGEASEAARAIVEPDDVGIAVPAGDVGATVAALRRLLEAPAAERAARRERARALMAGRYAWFPRRGRAARAGALIAGCGS